MTPNGELWFREETYSHDFSLDGLKKKHRFMHEMVHARQAQKACLSEHGGYSLVSLITVTA